MADYVLVPSQLTTILDTVNSLLRSIGETPVDTLEPPPTATVEQALQCLSEADLRVQARGWFWNREENFQTTLDSLGRVVLPDQCLEMQAAYYTSEGLLNVVARGLYLYDRTNHTYTFTTAPKVDYVVRLSWDYLPQAARALIGYEACQAFQASFQDRSIVFRVTDTARLDAQTTLEQAEDRNQQNNTVTGNISVASAVNSVRRNRRY